MPSNAENAVNQQGVSSKKVVIIGRLGPPNSRDITIQDFVINGEKVLPVFTDLASFKQQTAGSGFEDRAIEIDSNLLMSILRGDEVFMLNPGGTKPRRLSVPELRSYLSEAR